MKGVVGKVKGQRARKPQDGIIKIRKIKRKSADLEYLCKYHYRDRAILEGWTGTYGKKCRKPE